MATEPVAEINGRCGWAANAAPTSASPTTTLVRPTGASANCFATRANKLWHANPHNGVFSEGFQTTGSPQTKAKAVFQAQTATGKLKAVITPIGPNGCHCSISRCCGRSLAIVRP